MNTLQKYITLATTTLSLQGCNYEPLLLELHQNKTQQEVLLTINGSACSPQNMNISTQEITCNEGTKGILLHPNLSRMSYTVDTITQEKVTIAHVLMEEDPSLRGTYAGIAKQNKEGGWDVGVLTQLPSQDLSIIYSPNDEHLLPLKPIELSPEDQQHYGAFQSATIVSNVSFNTPHLLMIYKENQMVAAINVTLYEGENRHDNVQENNVE